MNSADAHRSRSPEIIIGAANLASVDLWSILPVFPVSVYLHPLASWQIPRFLHDAVHSSLDSALRETWCSEQRGCDVAPSSRRHGQECSYGALFAPDLRPAAETGLPREGPVPPPLVLHGVQPCRAGQRLKAGSPLRVEYVLVGEAGRSNARALLEGLVKAGVHGFGRGGRFWPGAVLQSCGDGRMRPPRFDATGGFPIDSRFTARRRNGLHELIVELETPLRALRFGRLDDDFSFPALVALILRRLRHLWSLYASRPVILDEASFLEGANRVSLVDVAVEEDRQVRRSGQGRDLAMFAGWIGWLRYTGELEPFLPLFQLVEWFHLGKGTSFGYGRVAFRRPCPRGPEPSVGR